MTSHGTNTVRRQFKMCGIFGSYNFKTYESLYIANRERGSFAYGSMYIRNTMNPGYIKETYIRKSPGVVDLTGDYAFQDQYEHFLGHTQAPTSVAREFSPVTSHPFSSIHYIVAHNGVLENTEQLIQDHIGTHDNPVDSSTIPIIMSYMIEFDDDLYDQPAGSTKTPELAAVEKTCNILNGTFACWVHSKMTGDTYVMRSGSTLFGNRMTGDFSSIKVPGICEDELDQGVVYCVTVEGLAECGSFDHNNPFFI